MERIKINIIENFEGFRLVPVVVLNDASKESIKRITEVFPEMIVGAGTVLTGQ